MNKNGLPVYAVILAGGRGSRMGSETPKQFIKVLGVPILIRSVQKFLSASAVDGVICSVPTCYKKFTSELLIEYDIDTSRVEITDGGADRSDSLKKAVEYLAKTKRLDSIVLTHDAVRPLIDERIINDNIAAATDFGACNTCIAATDTVFISADGRFISEVPDRATVFHAQTPQSFYAKKLYELIFATPPADFNKMTDGCSVFTYHGLPVAMVNGSQNNIKITYPDDIEKAEIIINKTR